MGISGLQNEDVKNRTKLEKDKDGGIENSEAHRRTNAKTVSGLIPPRSFAPWFIQCS
jgi:hypothetical protein